MVDFRQTWGEHRVYYQDEKGGIGRLPVGWTDAVEADPFVVVASGRAYIRFGDLLKLLEIVDGLRPSRRERGPRKPCGSVK